MSLPCVNCKREVLESEAKTFAQVFVCPDCFRVAEGLYARGERELKMLMVVLKEAIRCELIRGQLQFSSVEQINDVPKKDLVTHLADLADRVRSKKEDICNPSTPGQILLSATTSPRARSAIPSKT